MAFLEAYKSKEPAISITSQGPDLTGQSGHLARVSAAPDSGL
jgi:hypothetical protein